MGAEAGKGSEVRLEQGHAEKWEGLD
jgi:hypothetical protein